MDSIPSSKEVKVLKFCEFVLTKHRVDEDIAFGFVVMQRQGCNIGVVKELLGDPDCRQIRILVLFRACGVQKLSFDVFGGLIVALDGAGEDGTADRAGTCPPYRIESAAGAAQRGSCCEFIGRPKDLD